MHEADLLERVKERIGGGSDAEAARGLEATLMTLGERLSSSDAAVVAHELPPRFAKALQLKRRDPGLVLEEFYARVARRAQLPHAFGLEHAQAVCRTLCELLSQQARAQFCIDLWPELVRPSLEDRMAPLVATHGDRLATARPGSRHPLSEAHPDRAQAHSVVREDNPHAYRKLSSGAPSHGDTIAESKSGSRKPLNESKPLREGRPR